MSQIDTEKLQKEIGYGFGTTVGFTNDGKVFIVNDSKDAEGRPMQNIITFEPDEATRFATRIVETAEQAKKAKEVLGNG